MKSFDTQPSPSAVVLDDDRAAFDGWCNSIPANRSMGPWEIWQAARAASPPATATQPCIAPGCYQWDGTDSCTCKKATATQSAQTERALTDEQIMLLADDAGIPADETCPDTVLLKFARALLTAAQPASTTKGDQA
jgi:hypothetical protein